LYIRLLVIVHKNVQ